MTSRLRILLICGGMLLSHSYLLGISVGHTTPLLAPQGGELNGQSEFHGKRIRIVTIRVRDIFDNPSNMIYRSANQVKPSTKHHVVRQELLFTEGDTYDDFVISESIRNLRRQRYLRNVEVTPTIDGDEVDVLVSVQDTWTLIPQVSFSSGDGRTRRSVGLAESNLAGFGKRMELLYEEDEGREEISGVYDDRRVFGSHHELLMGFFDRSDGDRGVLGIGKPFRSLLDQQAWGASADVSDTVGRLFENGDERFIFGQDKATLGLRYTIARGNAEKKIRRYSFGYQYIDRDFRQATEKDYDNLNLDPDEVSNDIEDVPDDRRFSGAVFTYQQITPEYISANYIDRFDRVEDYNLGNSWAFTTLIAPESFGSKDDTLGMTGNFGTGWGFNQNQFLLSEIGFSSRLQDDDFQNTLARFEAKYFDVIGPVLARDIYLGKHTFAASFFLDYGDDLDKDRELLIGGDNAIRGYKARTFTGDKRIGLNLEDRIHISENILDLVSLGGVFFFDAGGSTDESLGRLVQDRIYSNIGLGLRVAFPRSSGGKVLRVDVAFPLREGPDGSDEFEPRIIFSGGQLFRSQLRSTVVGTERASVAVGFDR